MFKVGSSSWYNDTTMANFWRQTCIIPVPGYITTVKRIVKYQVW